jgi:hypothetical protein
MKRISAPHLFLLLLAFPFLSCSKDKNTLNADVIIYGGTSAAAAAVIAIDSKTGIQDVPYGQLEQVLLSKNQILNN